MNDAPDNHQDLADLLPAYAIGALNEAEATIVSRHLDTCPVCRLDLEGLRETVSLLAFATPGAVPAPGVKQALLARAARSTSGTTRPTRRPRLHQPRPVLAVLAATLLFALGGWNGFLQWQLHDARQQNAALATRAAERETLLGLLDNPAAVHGITGEGGEYGNGPAGFLYSDPNRSTALMLTYWMPALGPDQRYQLWLIRADGQRDSGGLFTVDQSGNAQMVVHAPAPFSQYVAVGITAEPYEGSPKPTSPRVMGGSLQ